MQATLGSGLTGVDPEDHERHVPTGEEWFQESVLFMFSDVSTGSGGVIRLGIHPARSAANLYCWINSSNRSVVRKFVPELPIPDGSLTDVAIDGLTIDTKVPYEEYRITVEVDDCLIELEWTSLMPAARIHVGAAKQSIAKGHYEILGRVDGRSVLEGERPVSFTGYGFSDHSWGVRQHHLPMSQWCFAAFDDDLIFQGFPVLGQDGQSRFIGIMLRDGQVMRMAEAHRTEVTLRDDWLTPLRTDVDLFDAEGRGFHLEGRTVGDGSIYPFLHGKICAHALAEFRFGGRIGTGLLELSRANAILDSHIGYYGLEADGIWARRTGEH